MLFIFVVKLNWEEEARKVSFLCQKKIRDGLWLVLDLIHLQRRRLLAWFLLPHGSKHFRQTRKEWKMTPDSSRNNIHFPDKRLIFFSGSGASRHWIQRSKQWTWWKNKWVTYTPAHVSGPRFCSVPAVPAVPALHSWNKRTRCLHGAAKRSLATYFIFPGLLQGQGQVQDNSRDRLGNEARSSRSKLLAIRFAILLFFLAILAAGIVIRLFVKVKQTSVWW